MENKELLVKYIRSKLVETPILAKERTHKNGKPLKKRSAFLRIRKFIDNFLSGNKSERVIIMPGLRGVGKTTLMFQTYNYLIEKWKIDPVRILYISADELKEYVGASLLEAISIFVEEIHGSSFVSLEEDLFILIDEAHFDEKWDVAAKIVYDKTDKIFLLITGSSALSMEMGVDLARRAKKEIIYPMNFLEHLILKYNVVPSRIRARIIRNLIFQPSENNIDLASAALTELLNTSVKIKRDILKEWKEFILWGGFPFTLEINERSALEKLSELVSRVIEKDVMVIRSFNTETRNTIARIIAFLSMQKPGGVSDVKLAGRIGTSPSLVRSILDVLEKTHLVFSIKPYGGAGKIVRKPWKYYFLFPSINSALRFKLGAYDPNDKDMLGMLAENLVAFCLLKMKEAAHMLSGIFYDPADDGVDFLLQIGLDRIIPVEVGVGRKDANQVKKAIHRYKSEYGILISDVKNVFMEDNVLHIPIVLFSLV